MIGIKNVIKMLEIEGNTTYILFLMDEFERIKNIIKKVENSVLNGAFIFIATVTYRV